MRKIRVLLVDDHTILRDGIRALLSLYDDIEVVGEASHGREAIDRARELSPNVVLMDLAMPGLGGLEATIEIRKECPESKVLILTQHENKEYIFPVLKAGASGYVLKKAAGTDLVTAIRAVHKGESFLDPSVAKAVIDGYVGKGRDQDENEEFDRLSDREKEVLKLVAEGHSNKEIADLLCLSVKTVMGHRANVMEKLGIHNRTELIRYAIRKGLIGVEA
ncbi:MAG: response regulator transcription factor [Dehalococcoidales bacterium]|nr:response regulator transcription factor [Dehalococcoidales bacterium]